jgi:hypothetical protein
MTRSQPMGGLQSMPARNNAGPSSFELGTMWGTLSTQMEHQHSLLQAILTGVERMPERLALRLSEQPKPGVSWNERFQVVRVVVPATLIASLIMTRILAPDAFVDIMQVIVRIPR